MPRHRKLTKDNVCGCTVRRRSSGWLFRASLYPEISYYYSSAVIFANLAITRSGQNAEI